MKEVQLDIASQELSGLSYFIRQQFDLLDNLCIFLEEAVRKEAKRRHALKRRQLKDCDGEEEQAFISVSLDDNLFEIERDFPRIVRYSLFVSMMSTTEACLVRLCRLARLRLEIPDKFKDKGPNVIERALKYLAKKGGLDISRMRYYSELADNLRNMRNAITHSEGCIKDRSQENEIRIFAKPERGVEIDTRNIIVLSDRFVTNNAHGMRQLVNQLHGKLKNKIGAHIAQ